MLEFKQNFRVIHADIDQTAAYARDIREYHYESRNSKVLAILVLTHADESAADVDTTTGVAIAPRVTLASAISEMLEGKNTKTDIARWLSSEYEPLPMIVEAAN